MLRKLVPSGSLFRHLLLPSQGVELEQRVLPSLAAWASSQSRALGTVAAGTDGGVAMHGTTVICIRKDDKVVIMADGQCTQGSAVIKPNVRKTRRVGDGVIGAFAGSTVDGFTLFERLEMKLEEHPNQLMRAAVELAKQWRSDKFLRRLDAVVVVADQEVALQITGNGDVLEPHDGIIAIGSGGPYALAAARALVDVPGMDAKDIAQKAMKIAADSCVYTNHNFTIETLGYPGSENDSSSKQQE